MSRFIKAGGGKRRYNMREKNTHPPEKSLLQSGLEEQTFISPFAGEVVVKELLPDEVDEE